ncbi:MAG: hypothetical protein CO189_08460 [candidate division Zixibacteria bacterium CG_4_9_14_3_um_filter_46_8]|nr:MAG: hypothetical protein CO189_08460 [candidate division Zixibacteria bacterium CG_4_9_14_3_um_filter_46_8]
MNRDKEYLLDIVEAARLALDYVSEKSPNDFHADTQCQDAVIRRIEIMGEAARRVSEETRAAHPEIPWNEIVGMRNIVIHKYDGVDLVIVWETIRNKIPPLVKELEGIIETF